MEKENGIDYLINLGLELGVRTYFIKDKDAEKIYQTAEKDLARMIYGVTGDDCFSNGNLERAKEFREQLLNARREILQEETDLFNERGR